MKSVVILKGGDSGVRLFDRLAKRPARSYVAPTAVVVNPESFRLVPMHHILVLVNSPLKHQQWNHVFLKRCLPWVNKMRRA